MKPITFMIIAGEASGDLRAAELVRALRATVIRAEFSATADVQPLRTALAPRFFGAGGPRMAAEGVELSFDLTRHAVIGMDAIKGFFKFRRFRDQLFRLAVDRQPDVIIGVDFSEFNRRLAHAIKTYVRGRNGQFHGWNPRLVQFPSPQLWASRPNRVYQLAADFDLILSIFPFEKAWYARRVPKFHVEFVGHPIVEQFRDFSRAKNHEEQSGEPVKPLLLLLPGSRPGELRRHIPAMLGALKIMQSQAPSLRARMVVPNEELVRLAKEFSLPTTLEIQVGGLHTALAEAHVAIAKTGTVTMECAYFGLPTVAIYKTSWSTYQIGKRIVTLKYLAMPNVLADSAIFPEFIQDAATPENIADAALDLWRNPARRQQVKTQLAAVMASLGGPGASERAAKAIVGLLRGHAPDTGSFTR